MQYMKTWKILQACGVFILILCILFIEGINENTAALLGTIGSKRISVEAKESFINNGKSGFNENDIYKFENNLKHNICSFAFPFEVNIKNSSHNLLIKALAVNSSYKNFTSINIVDGSFLTEKDGKSKARNLIIEENTALRLFKSTDIIGMHVKLMNVDFRITGIYKSKNSFLHNLVKKKEPEVYIPLQTVFSLNKDITIPCFQISTLSRDGVIQNKRNVMKSIENIGKSSANYIVVDYMNSERQFSQASSLLTFVFGILIIILLLRIQGKIVKEVFIIIKERYSSHYFFEVIKSSRKILIYSILKLSFLTFSIYLISQAIKFDFYLSPTSNNVIQYYINSILNIFFQIGASKSLLDCIIHFSMFLICFVFILGIPLGFLLLLSSFFFLKNVPSSIDRVLLFFSITYIFSLLTASIAIKISNLPLVINMKTMLLIYIFVFLKNITTIEDIKSLEQRFLSTLCG